MPSNRDIEWFKDWFNSPYYHLLYKDRDQCEAESLIDRLISFLRPAPQSRVLDLACGKGRHSVYLSKKGFDVTGIDLSPESIAYASQQENEHLHFYVHDMRNLFLTNYFDLALNLFTSFGYFESEHDDIATITAVSKGLKAEGIFVLDFMNIYKVIKELVPAETKVVSNIEFQIDKKIENGFIVKDINITDKGKKYHFREKVKALTLPDFEKYFATSQLKIVDLRGDYALGAFDEKRSKRLIIIAKKINE